MVQALCLSCRNEVLALKHGGLEPATDQLQRTYFEMALVFFGYASLLAQKSRAIFSTNQKPNQNRSWRLLRDLIGSRDYELAL